MRATAAHLLLPLDLIRVGDRKAVLVVLLASLLPAIHRYVGATTRAPAGIGPGTGIADLLPLFLSAFVLLGLVPLLVILILFRDGLSEYGFRLGDWRRGIAYVAILAPTAAVLILLPASRSPELRAAYPMDREALHSIPAFIRLELARGALFYVAWEAFFRGFILFGLRRRLGATLAICIQTVPSCLWHIGLPTGETVSSILGGVVLGAIAIRTRSILWPLLLHFLLGMSLDFWIVVSA